jgi:hypothetical protein
MNIIEISAFIRELRIIMEIIIVQDSIDINDPYLCETYSEWVDSMKWLIDLGWNKGYCIN